MATFNINIEDSGVILNPDNINIYYGSSSSIPTTEVEVKNLNTQILTEKTINFILDNNFKNHYLVLPFGISIEKIINVNNMGELITNHYNLKTSEILIDNYQYKIYALENDAVYLEEALHKINIDGTYNGTV